MEIVQTFSFVLCGRDGFYSSEKTQFSAAKKSICNCGQYRLGVSTSDSSSNFRYILQGPLLTLKISSDQIWVAGYFGLAI
jgi:hypothetical protein